MNQSANGINPLDPAQFEQQYRDARVIHDLPAATPWDIGTAQPAVRRLVALGALRGEVLDPGTGPGHHAIYYATQGYSVTGIDASAAAIERARRNADTAQADVNFVVADATNLNGLDAQFDTVVDSAFYHLFYGHPELQLSYLQALHSATKPGARLFMFEFADHSINGYILPMADSEQRYRQLLPTAGWDITYIGRTTYQVNFDITNFENLSGRGDERAAAIEPLLERFRTIDSWLVDGRAHAPAWEVHATRAGGLTQSSYGTPRRYVGSA